MYIVKVVLMIVKVFIKDIFDPSPCNLLIGKFGWTKVINTKGLPNNVQDRYKLTTYSISSKFSWDFFTGVAKQHYPMDVVGRC